MRFRSPLITIVVPITVLALMTSLFYFSGALFTGSYPSYLPTEGAANGLTLLLIMAPAYISLASILGARRTIELAGLLDHANRTQLQIEISSVPVRVLLGAMFLGFLYATIANIPGYGINFFSADSAEKAYIVGQIIIWVAAACMLAYRVRVSHAFRRTSRLAPIDLYDQTSLKPFAQVGLIDVLTIAGGLVLTTIQSLDLSFRPENYAKAIVVLLPALVFLAVYPMSHLHSRMKAAKVTELSRLNQMIATCDRSLAITSMDELERLLRRKDRILSVSTWPLDTSIVQRFIFYIVIPPLAWIGAAIVEFAIDSLIHS